MWAEPVVWVVEDDPEMRELLVRLLTSVGHSVEAYASPTALLGDYDRGRPGCLLLDLSLPEMSGLELWQALRERGSHHPLLIISGHGNVTTAVASMHQGAVDFIEKPFEHSYLIRRVDDALGHDARERERRCKDAEFRARVDSLTPREREVLEMVAEGFLTKQIAWRMGISEKTVEVHRSHVTKKMGVNSTVQLVRLVTQHLRS